MGDMSKPETDQDYSLAGKSETSSVQSELESSKHRSANTKTITDISPYVDLKQVSSLDTTTTRSIDLPLVKRRFDTGGGFSWHLAEKEDGEKILRLRIYRPDDMDDAKWEKEVINNTQSFAKFGVAVRRVEE